MLKLFKLQELIKKYRKSTSNYNSLITKSLKKIKKAINDSYKEVKVFPLQKLIFFYLNYYNFQWASYSTLEILKKEII